MLLLTACVHRAAAPEPTVVRIAWSDVGVPTPFRISTVGPGGPVLLTLLFDTLTWKDEHGIVPWLATSWEVSPDGRDVTFMLAHDVRWHDDQPLTAADVAFSFDYYAQHPYGWMPTSIVDTASVVASDRVDLRLKRPYPAFIEEIAGVLPILPKHIWQSVGDPVHFDGPGASTGSGPYKLAEYRSADGAYRLTSNTDYFKGRPRTDEVQQLNLPNDTMLQAVQQGTADLAWTTDASVVDVFANKPRVRVLPTAPLSIVRLVLNTERAPLDQLAVRQALAYALDRSLIARTLTRGEPIVGSFGVIPPETPWFSTSVRQYPNDPAQARGLLAGQRLSIELLANPEYREPELLAPMLEAIGITLQIRRVDGPTKAQLVREGHFQMAELQHIGIGGDPDYLRRWYSGLEGNQSAQGDILHNAQFELLAQQQATSLDPVARKPLIDGMQAVLAEQLPTIPLFYRRFYWVYDSSRISPINTYGGLMNGIPFVHNKLIFLSR